LRLPSSMAGFSVGSQITLAVKHTAFLVHPHSTAAADCDPMLTAALLRVHTRASHPSCSRAGSAGTSNHSAYLDGQRRVEPATLGRRPSAAATAPLRHPSREGSPAEGQRGGGLRGPGQAGGHGRASVAVGCRMGCCEPGHFDHAGIRPRHRRQVDSPKPREEQARAWAGFRSDWVRENTGTSCDGCRRVRLEVSGLEPCAWRARARRR